DHFFCRLDILILAVHEQCPETLQETVYSVNSSVVPLCVQLRRSHKELVHPQGVAAVVSYKVVRGNDVSFGLTHLDAVLSCDQSRVEQLVERLVKVDHADVAQEFCIKSGVQQMKHCMLNAANVHIHREHLVRLLT